MSSEGLKQNRLGWLTPDLQVAEEGETLYFTGCLPYFGFLFKDIGVESPFEAIGERAALAAAATVRLLNAGGCAPVVMDNERCCGHDFLWNGDVGLFERLARLNIAAIKARGVKRIVSSCPECVRTLSLDYPQVERLDVEVLHTSQFFARLAEDGRLRFKGQGERTVTFHDPCRLGRHLGVFDEPRALLHAVPGLKLAEMADSRGESTCCGGPTGWLSCGPMARQIQVARLAEAQATGADTLVTACPKCQIHLTCGSLGSLPEGVAAPSLDITDLSVLLAEALDEGEAPPEPVEPTIPE
jgi:Fe-S oxidoreductase